MARTIVIAGNWKLNLSVEEGVALAGALAKEAGNDREIVVFPTALSVYPAVQAAAGSKVEVGVQNAYWEVSGAYTGELSPELAKAAGAKWVLIGHSERRQYFGETNETCNQRVQATLRAGLKPMLCIGETLEERESGRLDEILRGQITGGLANLSADDLADLVIAYEPVWAIGTGVVATEEQAQDAHALSRGIVRDLLGDAFADSVRILYGGSVKPDNAAGLLGQEDIDGALVGGASLKADVFSGIINS